MKPMEQCICNDPSSKIETICDACGIQLFINMNEDERKFHCPIHGGKILSTCGLLGHICSSCSKAGWVSTRGDGGPPGAFNQRTSVKTVIPRPKPTPSELF